MKQNKKGNGRESPSTTLYDIEVESRTTFRVKEKFGENAGKEIAVISAENAENVVVAIDGPVNWSEIEKAIRGSTEWKTANISISAGLINKTMT